MAKKKTTTKKDELPAFEQSLESLQDVVQQLEDGQLSLTESLDQYEQGVKHLKHCHQSLKSAQRKIELLVKLDADGNLITQDFDDAATEAVNQRPGGTASATGKTGTRKRKSPRPLTPDQQELADDLESETDSEDHGGLF